MLCEAHTYALGNTNGNPYTHHDNDTNGYTNRLAHSHDDDDADRHRYGENTCSIGTHVFGFTGFQVSSTSETSACARQPKF